jgi:TBC1 domain family member 20
MLVCKDDSLSFLLAEKLSLHYLRDFMKADLKDTMMLMDLLWPLLEFEDTVLYEFFESASLPPYFITSWLITWFSHDVKDLETIARIFDVLICSPPIYILYMCAAVSHTCCDSILPYKLRA